MDQLWLALSFQAGRTEVVRRMEKRLWPSPGELQSRSREKAEAALRRLDQIGGRLVTYLSDEYPEPLKHIPHPPAILYCVGPLRLHQVPAVAVVGSRKASRYGLRMASELGHGLGAAGITVISGMALGVDSTTQRAALAAGGKTVAVLACGVDVIYPPRERSLYHEIARRGLLVSEYPPGMPALKHHFPVRNRLISGLSEIVVLVEGRIGSGSLITVAHATEQNRDLLAVPGEVGNPLAEGSLRLIRDGAGLVMSAEDVLVALSLRGHRVRFPSVPKKTTLQVSTALQLAVPGCEELLEHLALGPQEPDRLTAQTGLPASRVLAALSALELFGVVERLPDGSVHRISRSGGG